MNNQGLVQGSTSIFVVVFVDYFLIGWWDHSNSAMTSEQLFKPAGMKKTFIDKSQNLKITGIKNHFRNSYIRLIEIPELSNNGFLVIGFENQTDKLFSLELEIFKEDLAL